MSFLDSKLSDTTIWVNHDSEARTGKCEMSMYLLSFFSPHRWRNSILFLKIDLFPTDGAILTISNKWVRHHDLDKSWPFRLALVSAKCQCICYRFYFFEINGSRWRFFTVSTHVDNALLLLSIVVNSLSLNTVTFTYIYTNFALSIVVNSLSLNRVTFAPN